LIGSIIRYLFILSFAILVLFGLLLLLLLFLLLLLVLLLLVLVGLLEAFVQDLDAILSRSILGFSNGSAEIRVKTLQSKGVVGCDDPEWDWDCSVDPWTGRVGHRK
jgi:hypothetical protein